MVVFCVSDSALFPLSVATGSWVEEWGALWCWWKGHDALGLLVGSAGGLSRKRQEQREASRLHVCMLTLISINIIPIQQGLVVW